VTQTDNGDDSPEDEGTSEAVPDNVIALAKAAFKSRPRGTLANLVFDSLVDEAASLDDHRLRFEHSQQQIELHISTSGDDTTMSGTLRGGIAAKVALDLEGSELALITEVADGSFHFGPVPHGLVRLAIDEGKGTTTVTTDWFRV
jgi:hypothetical protein